MADKKKVRIYRGEGKPSDKPMADWIKQGQDEAGITDAKGRWWTKDKDIANWYVKEAGDKGRMVYQDLPRSVVSRGSVGRNKRAARHSLDPGNEVFLPKKYVGKGTELHPAEIKSNLLEKAEFGKFARENQDALATLQKEKKDLRVKRKLKQAQARAEQVRVKFKEPSRYDRKNAVTDFYDKKPEMGLREAKIKVGNKVAPIRATFKYLREGQIKGSGLPTEIQIRGLYPESDKSLDYSVNKVFKPSQLKQVLHAVKNRYKKAESIVGERISGSRAHINATNESLIQRIRLGKLGKKGLLGLGLSLQQAIQAGKAAYDESEGKM